MKRVLGLDLGTNSLGWAVIDVPESDSEIGAVVAMGSRVFPDGAEITGSKTVTKAAERRAKRSQRRQIARRSQRRRLLRTELTRLGLLPVDESEFTNLMNENPNLLLADGCNGRQLTLRDIGRVLYWLSSKRGFLSLRSGGSNIVDDEDEGYVPPRYRVNQYNAKTGERKQTGQEDVLIDFLRSQAKFYPQLLTETIIFGRRGRLTYPVKPIARQHFLSAQNATVIDEFGLHGIIFFQRAVYWDRKTIGLCSLNPVAGKPRAARAERQSQTFIIWQSIINLKVEDDERPLTHNERRLVFEKLNNQKSVAFSVIQKLLGLNPDAKINFERPDTTGLKGNQTDPEMASKLKDAWSSLSDTQKDRLVFLLLGNATDEQLRVSLKSEFGLTPQQVDTAIGIRLVPGRMNYSRQTIHRLLKHLPQAATLREATAMAGFCTPEEQRENTPVNISTIANPLVKASLSQVQKVLAALTKRFAREDGKTFDIIRVELSRDVSNSQKQRELITKQQRENERSRKTAISLINDFAPGAENSSDNIRRARLWNDQQQMCLYCGQPITATALFTNTVQVDHILPRSQTLNNSMGNVAVVHASENQAKGDRTIFEWVGEQRMLEIADRTEQFKLPRGKVRNITTEHVDENQIPSSLLTQTGYINTLARDVIYQQTGITPEVSRGRLTAALLYRIGLKKNRDDHRRHAQDAAMVALTNVGIAQQLARRYKQERDYGQRRDDEYGSWEPWRGLRQDLLNRYDQIVVSHRQRRKINGQLHEETYYGKVNSPLSGSQDLYARRRSLASGLTSNQLNEVADPVVKKTLVQNLESRGINPQTASKLTFEPADLPCMPDGTKITSVRCHMNLPGNLILRPETNPKTGITLSNNHAAYLYENQNTKRWRIHVVTRFDAYQLRDRKESELRARYAKKDETFLFSVATGDTIRLTDPKTKTESFWSITGLDGTDGRLLMKEAHDSTTNKPQRFSSAKMKEHLARKVSVTPDGRLRNAHD